MVSVNFNAMGREKTKEEGSVKGFFWIFKNLSSMIDQYFIAEKEECSLSIQLNITYSIFILHKYI